jgi:5-methylcytosine-specific restriction endonuclease McrA
MNPMRATEAGRASDRRDNARRRAALSSEQATLTAAEWTDIRERHKYRCHWCKKKFKRLTQDHVIPLSKGGLHVKENVVPSCLSCNSARGNRLLHIKTGQYLLAV